MLTNSGKKGKTIGGSRETESDRKKQKCFLFMFLNCIEEDRGKKQKLHHLHTLWRRLILPLSLSVNPLKTFIGFKLLRSRTTQLIHLNNKHSDLLVIILLLSFFFLFFLPSNFRLNCAIGASETLYR